MRGIEFHPVVEGLKARDVTARGEAPGTSPTNNFPPCKGGTWGEVFTVMGWVRGGVLPLQGGGKCFWDTDTQGFTLGYHLAPLQSYRSAGFQDFGLSGVKARDVKARAKGPRTETPPPQFAVPSGLKARDVKARAEGPGTRPTYFSKPCKGGTLDAESAEVLGNIQALL